MDQKLNSVDNAENVTPTQIFTHEVQLPSMGKVNGIPAIIGMRSMKTGEEKLFSSMLGGSRATTVVSQLIKACTNIPCAPEQLTVDDRYYLLLKLRAITYDPEYKVEMNCMYCTKKFLYIFDIDNQEVKYLEDDSITFDVKLPVKGDTVTLKRVDGIDEEAISRYERNMGRVKMNVVSTSKHAQDDDIEGDVSYIYRIVRSIDAVNGKKMDARMLTNYVENLVGKDSLAIRNALDDHVLGLNIELRIDCPSCGQENHRMLQMTPEFFRPRL